MPRLFQRLTRQLAYLCIGFCVVMMSSQAAFSASGADAALRQQIGQKIMIGFVGKHPHDPQVQEILKCAEQGLIGGVIFFAHNIESPAQLQKLMAAFRAVKAPFPLLLALDQEGGKVQRLSSKNGFQDTPSAADIAQHHTPEEAEKIYVKMGQQVAKAGFNLVLGPVVDLAHPRPERSPAIAKIGRSFGQDPETVIAYATAFIKGCHQAGVLTALKHFPGHGLAEADTHDGYVDMTRTFQPKELEPFYRLIDSGQADMVMTAHVLMTTWDKIYPATLSKAILHGLLRGKGYEAIPVISDCLLMGAIQQHFDLKTILLKSIEAGIDIMLFSNHPQIVDPKRDKKTQKSGAVSPVQQVTEMINLIEAACADGLITQAQIQQSYARVLALKERF